jgi:hypothetical protein
MKPRLALLLLSMMLGASVSARAADGGTGPGGGSGGGGFWCRLMCDIRHGSCTIPSGDPDVPPLRDPFCEERKAACRAGCGGGGGGGLIIGARQPRPATLIASAQAFDCDAVALRELVP